MDKEFPDGYRPVSKHEWETARDSQSDPSFEDPCDHWGIWDCFCKGHVAAIG